MIFIYLCEAVGPLYIPRIPASRADVFGSPTEIFSYCNQDSIDLSPVYCTQSLSPVQAEKSCAQWVGNRELDISCLLPARKPPVGKGPQGPK